jgi:hypothetical protein
LEGVEVEFKVVDDSGVEGKKLETELTDPYCGLLYTAMT